MCAAQILKGSPLFYRKEPLKSRERPTTREKGLAPKDLFQNGENGNETKGYTSKKDSEIYGGIKILIVGLFLALALWISAGGGDHQFDAAVWGLFVAGVGLAKIIVGMLMGRAAAQE